MDKRPVSVMWESTIACNLSCKHCKASARRTPDKDELSTGEAKALIDQIATFGAPYPILRITGGNALMRKDIFELIKYAKRRGLKVTIAPATTPLLNRKSISKLKNAGVDVVAISIDGHTAEAHDGFRGVAGTFDMMLAAAKTMREIKLPFRLLTTVTRFNASNLPAIFKLAKKLGACGWYLYMLIPTGRARIEHEIRPEEFEDVLNFVYDAMQYQFMTVNAIAGGEPFRRVAVMRKLVEEERLNKEKLKLGELYYHLKNKTLKLFGKPPVRKAIKSSKATIASARPRVLRASFAIASAFGKGIFVSNTGIVYPSSFLPIEIGNVRKDALKNIYKKAKLLKDLQNSKKLKGRCRICEFNDVCRGSRSRAYAVTGDCFAEDPYCSYMPGSIEKIKDGQKILEELQVTNFSRRG